MPVTLRSIFMIASPALVALLGLIWFTSRKKDDDIDDRKPPDKVINKVEKPITKAEQPVTKGEQPVTKVEPPLTKVEQPVTKGEQPVTKVEKPVSKEEQLATKVEKSATKAEPPLTKVEQPVTKAEPPITKAELPVIKAEPLVIASRVQKSHSPKVQGSKLLEAASEFDRFGAGGDNTANTLGKRVSKEEIRLLNVSGQGDAKAPSLANGHEEPVDEVNTETIDKLITDIDCLNLNNNVGMEAAKEGNLIDVSKPESDGKQQGNLEISVVANHVSGSQVQCHLNEGRTVCDVAEESCELALSKPVESSVNSHPSLTNSILDLGFPSVDTKDKRCPVEKDSETVISEITNGQPQPEEMILSVDIQSEAQSIVLNPDKRDDTQGNAVNGDDHAEIQSSSVTQSIAVSRTNRTELQGTAVDAKEDEAHGENAVDGAQSGKGISSSLEVEVSQVTESCRTIAAKEGPIESPVSESNSDDHSEMSADSGKGQSIDDVASSAPAQQAKIMASYQFNFPTHLCGLLIGKHGKHINVLKEKSGANISVKRIPYVEELQAVYFEGTQEEVDKALSLMKQRFPPTRYPELDFTDTRPMSSGPVLQPEMMQLHLPEGVSVDVVVSSVVQPNHVFVQQPTHPTFPMLERMNQCMNICYQQEGVVPQLPRPIEVGVICAAPMYNGWYRAQVVMFDECLDECDIRFVDYGGYMRIQGCMLRQIRSDFTTLPFQGVECYLANVIPPKGAETFPEEAGAVLESLVQGKLLQAEVVAHEEDGVPYVQMYEMQGEQMQLMNRELVDRGLAQWLEQF